MGPVRRRSLVLLWTLVAVLSVSGCQFGTTEMYDPYAPSPPCEGARKAYDDLGGPVCWGPGRGGFCSGAAADKPAWACDPSGSDCCFLDCQPCEWVRPGSCEVVGEGVALAPAECEAFMARLPAWYPEACGGSGGPCKDAERAHPCPLDADRWYCPAAGY